MAGPAAKRAPREVQATALPRVRMTGMTSLHGWPLSNALTIHLSPARQGGEPYAGIPRGREHPLGQGRGESPAREAPVSSRAEGRGSTRLYLTFFPRISVNAIYELISALVLLR